MDSAAAQLRRRQLLAVLAAMVAAVAIVVAIALAGRSSDSPSTEVVDDRAGVVKIRDAFAGRELIAARESTRGRPLSLRVATSGSSEWLVTCTRVSPEYVLHETLDGRDERTAPCSQSATIGQTLSFRFTSDAPGGNDRELQLWLTRADTGERVSPKAAVLAAAVYSLPDSVATLGGADILPIEESDGQEWTYVDGGESAVGARSYTQRFEAVPGPSILELVMTGSSEATVRLVVDGDVVSTVPARYRLGSVELGDRLVGGAAHTVTLEIVGKVPADAHLAIVQRAED